MPNPNVPALSPPKILVGAPKKFVKALDVSRFIEEALTAINYPEPLSIIIALHTLESYLDAAKREQRRISKAQNSVWKLKRLRQSGLFHDAHFYLISWARIAKLARFIAEQTRFRRTGLVLRQYNTALKQRIDGRDHLEHFEERLPGGPKHGKLIVPNDLLNMTNEYLSYGGHKIDIGTKSIHLLKTIVEEFRKALLFDAIEALESTKPDILRTLFKDAATSIWISALQKKAERQIGITK
jgi:hypothetical protein